MLAYMFLSTQFVLLGRMNYGFLINRPEDSSSESLINRLMDPALVTISVCKLMAQLYNGSHYRPSICPNLYTFKHLKKKKT